jgi:hypothetical protein
MNHRVDDALRDLRSSGSVEEDRRDPVALVVKSGELPAKRSNVEHGYLRKNPLPRTRLERVFHAPFH